MPPPSLLPQTHSEEVASSSLVGVHGPAQQEDMELARLLFSVDAAGIFERDFDKAKQVFFIITGRGAGSSRAGLGTPRRAELGGPSAADHGREQGGQGDHTADEPVPQIMKKNGPT